MRTYTMNQKTKKEENMVSENLTPLPSSTKNNKCEYHDNETELLALKRLDETSTRLQKQGNYLEALECMERSLVLRSHFFGLNSDQVQKACKVVGEMCNLLAMTFLQDEGNNNNNISNNGHTQRSRRKKNDRNELVYELLKKAEILTKKGDPQGKAITCNNLACFYRKQGKLRNALQYLKQALKIENDILAQERIMKNQHNHNNNKNKMTTSTQQQKKEKSKMEPSENQKETCDNKGVKQVNNNSNNTKNSADTHLNICAVLSQLGRHTSALGHAQAALILLQEELLEELTNNYNERNNNNNNHIHDEESKEHRKNETNDATIREKNIHTINHTDETDNPEDNIDNEHIHSTNNNTPPSILRLDRIAVLAIAYHNIGTEQEFLKRLDQALQSYQKGMDVCARYLGIDHTMTKTLKHSCILLQKKIDIKKEHTITHII